MQHLGESRRDADFGVSAASTVHHHRPQTGHQIRHRVQVRERRRTACNHLPTSATLIIFRPLIMGEKNCNLCCVFFSKFCQISILLLHLVNSSNHGGFGRSSARQTRGRGFEPGLMRFIFGVLFLPSCF